MTEQEFNDMSMGEGFGLPTRGNRNIIMAIGVGGGGSNAVRHMYEQGIEGVSFVICNTDRQALLNSPVPTRVLLGKTGLGAGGDFKLAAEDAETTAENIRSILTDNIKMVFVTAGMGGGTGTGAGPVVARLAREKGILTVGIVTLPFLFEGTSKILKALDGAEEMSKYVDALLMINNQRLSEIYPDLNMLNAFDKADDTLSIAARSISDIITIEGKINRDFNDVATTLRNGGTAIISTGYGEGENRVTKAIKDALNSPLLRNNDIYSSKKLLYVIYFSPDSNPGFQMSETNELVDFTSSIDPGVEIIWGVYPDTSLGNKVKITILASGFESTVQETLRPTSQRRAAKVDYTAPAVDPMEEAPVIRTSQERLKEQYGPDIIEKSKRDQMRKRQVILSDDQLDDDAAIEALEKSVAFNRDRRTVEEIQAIRSTVNPAPAVTPAADAGMTVNFLDEQ